MDFLATIDTDGRATGFYLRDLHGDAIPAGAIPISAEVHAAWIQDTARQRWTGEGLEPFDPPPPPPVVPPSITRRQLLLALAGAGLISGEEALAAAMTGAVPAAIDGVFAQLPAAEALGARITWATMSVAERDHPLIGALIAAGLATADQVDALFTAAAQL
jgi:hypothetical protein